MYAAVYVPLSPWRSYRRQVVQDRMNPPPCSHTPLILLCTSQTSLVGLLALARLEDVAFAEILSTWQVPPDQAKDSRRGNWGESARLVPGRDVSSMECPCRVYFFAVLAIAIAIALDFLLLLDDPIVIGIAGQNESQPLCFRVDGDDPWE